MIFVPQSVHGCPEPLMAISCQLIFLRQPTQRFLLPNILIPVQVAKYLGLQDKVPTIDPATVSFWLFNKLRDLSSIDLQSTEAARQLDGSQCRVPPLPL